MLYGIKWHKMALSEIDFAYEVCHKSVEEHCDRFVEIINKLVLLNVLMHMSTGTSFGHPKRTCCSPMLRWCTE